MIPKIIHYCWLSDDPYPEKVEECMESWKKYLPDYEFIKWDRSKFDVNQFPYTKSCYDLKLYAYAADYIRLYAIYNYGGIYLDSDVEMLKPFDDFILNREYILSKWANSYIVATTIGCEKENPMIGKIKEYYENNYLNKPIDVVNQQIMEIEIAKALSGTNVNLIDSDYICPLPKNGIINNLKPTKDTYCIHYAMNGWAKAIAKERNRIFMKINKEKEEKKKLGIK